jgi:putative transposase
MSRGASHATTFHDDLDYKMFLCLLLQIHRRYRFEIHAYCLMPNHYHLLIRTPSANLSDGMRHLNGLYTQYYNKKYEKDGALFRGRYKAILVDAESYLLRLSRYIHLNPVKSGLVKHPEKYLWSSYQFYKNNVTSPDWLFTQEILARFGAEKQKNKYSLFVMEKLDHELENFYNKIKLLPILGTEVFCKQISQIYLEATLPDKNIPDSNNIRTKPQLEKICMIVTNYYGVSVEVLHEIKPKCGNKPRAIAIYLIAELSGKKFKDIAVFFKNISCTGISQIIWRINQLKSQDKSLAIDIDNLTKKILAEYCQ